MSKVIGISPPTAPTIRIDGNTVNTNRNNQSSMIVIDQTTSESNIEINRQESQNPPASVGVNTAGKMGFTGSQGETGFTGSQGVSGAFAALGFTGSQGDIGFDGSSGFAGSQGEPGFTGSQGDIGYTGSFGFTGSQGEIGFTGSIGFAGSQGFVGSQGEIGFTGSQGKGIQSLFIANNELIVEYSDDEEENLGTIIFNGSSEISSNFDAIEGNGIKFTDVDNVKEISLDEQADVAFNSLSLNTDGFIQFQDGTKQSTTAPRFFYESFKYQTEKTAGGIIPGDYLYDYANATLFVTTFVPFNGWVTNKGSGYAPGEFFALRNDVNLIGGSGSGATVDALIFFGQVFTVTLKNPGSGYSIGDSLTVDFQDGGSGFEVILNSVELGTGIIKDGDTTLFDITVY